MVPGTGILLLSGYNSTPNNTPVSLGPSVASGQYQSTLTPADILCLSCSLQNTVTTFGVGTPFSTMLEHRIRFVFSPFNLAIQVWSDPESISVMSFSPPQGIYDLSTETILGEKLVFGSLKPEEGTDSATEGQV